MNNLHQYLDEASRQYYTGNPVISDEVFDALADSINYNKVGTMAENEEQHLFPLFSLNKYYEGESTRPLEGYANKDISISPKLDGACVSLLYIGGKLVRALTRGDGIKGKLITDKFLATNNLVPHTIPHTEPLQVIFEVVASKDIENSRNYAAGSLNLKDINEFKTRAIVLLAHGVQPALTETYEEDIQILANWGFNTVKESGLTAIFPSDGIVFRVNNNSEYFRLGHTAKHPLGAYALKERSEGAVTTLLDVIWQVGKSGKVTPVAILKPVYIEDALISRATLNNGAFIEALGLEIGDQVHVIRAGSIIPCITHKVE